MLRNKAQLPITDQYCRDLEEFPKSPSDSEARLEKAQDLPHLEFKHTLTQTGSFFQSKAILTGLTLLLIIVYGTFSATHITSH